MAFNGGNTSQKIMLDILSCSLQNKKYTTQTVENWQEIFKESHIQAVALQVFDAIDSNIVFDKNQWQNYALASFGVNAEIHNQHAYLHRLMTKNNIDYCILKGSSSAFYYPNPKLRAMGDVDFLVRPSDLEKATEILIEDGFQKWDRDHECHIVFRKGKMHFEMHFEPAGLPKNDKGEVIKQYLEDIFEKAETVKLDEDEFIKPDDFHHGIIIIMHMYHHLLGEGIGLRHLFDWATFVNQIDNDRFVTLFKEKLEKIGLWRFVQIISQLSHLYLGVPYREFMGDIDKKLCEDLIFDILDGGNFGRNNRNRSVQGKLISNRGKSGVKNSNILQIIRRLNENAKELMPKFSEIPILNKLAFIPIGVMYLFGMITGKRKTPDINGTTFRQAQKRRKLYKNFHLFETEK